MNTQPPLEISAFCARTWPAPAELGEALESNKRISRAVLQLHFGTQVAGIPMVDIWSACCELLLQAELVRERRLNRFVLDVEHVFDVSAGPGVVLCRFSAEHLFVVAAEEFAASLEQVVEHIFAGTTCPRVMALAARWSASEIRGQPYSIRFSDSVLT